MQERLSALAHTVQPHRGARLLEFFQPPQNLLGHGRIRERKHRRSAKLPEIRGVDAQVLCHERPVELVDRALDRVVPPAARGERARLELGLGECAFSLEHRDADADERGVAALRDALPGDVPLAEQRLFLALMERLELCVRRRMPRGRAGARRLVDLQIGAGVVAQAVPRTIGEPGRSRHRSRLVRGPEAEEQPAPQLVLVFFEHARKLDHDRAAGGVVGRRFARPRILVPADHDKVARFARLLGRQLGDRDLHRPPAVGHVGAEPHAHRAFRAHILELQPRDPRNPDAGKRCHLGLHVLGRRVAPHRLHGAVRHRSVFGTAPIHHHRADRAALASDALLLVPRRRVRKLGKDDLAAHVLRFEIRQGSGADVHQFSRNSLRHRLEAMPERVRLDRDVGRRLDAKFRVLGEADDRRQLVDDRVGARRAHRVAAVFGHAPAVFRACRAMRDLRDDALYVRAYVRYGNFLDDFRLRHGRNYFFGSGGNISIIFGPRLDSKLRMLSCSLSGPVNTGL
jgi:hypothetical protein